MTAGPPQDVRPSAAEGWQPIDRRALARPSPEVAPDLLGAILHHPADGTAVRIIEVEAYTQDDPACHAHRGRTAANATLFGPAGHLYVYFTYGMHFCANVVTGREGVGEGVLIRAAEALAGDDLMRRRRQATTRTVTAKDLLRGPARLAQALGIARGHDGVDLLGPSGRSAGGFRLLSDGSGVAEVRTGPRVGVRLAADLPWRFWVADHPGVSPYRRHPRAPICS